MTMIADDIFVPRILSFSLIFVNLLGEDGEFYFILTYLIDTNFNSVKIWPNSFIDGDKMLKNWTTRKLMAIGGLAALDFIVHVMASVLTITSGIVMASGTITAIVGPLLLSLCLLTVDRFGAGFVFLTLVGILDLPLAIAGPPGFLPKILIFMSMGLIADLLYAVFKKRSKLLAVSIVGGLDDIYLTFTVIVVGLSLGIPGVEKTVSLVPLPIFTIMLFTVGIVSGYAGYLIYQKIENTSVVKRIQG